MKGVDVAALERGNRVLDKTRLVECVGMDRDCNVELRKNMTLIARFDSASNGNVVQCGEIGGIGVDTTFTLALGYGGDAASALAAAEGSLAAINAEADEVVTVVTARRLRSVGEWYADFGQLTDADVLTLLAEGQPRKQREP